MLGTSESEPIFSLSDVLRDMHRSLRIQMDRTKKTFSCPHRDEDTSRYLSGSLERRDEFFQDYEFGRPNWRSSPFSGSNLFGEIFQQFEDMDRMFGKRFSLFGSSTSIGIEFGPTTHIQPSPNQDKPATSGRSRDEFFKASVEDHGLVHWNDDSLTLELYDRMEQHPRTKCADILFMDPFREMERMFQSFRDWPFSDKTAVVDLRAEKKLHPCPDRDGSQEDDLQNYSFSYSSSSQMRHGDEGQYVTETRTVESDSSGRERVSVTQDDGDQVIEGTKERDGYDDEWCISEHFIELDSEVAKSENDSWSMFGSGGEIQSMFGNLFGLMHKERRTSQLPQIMSRMTPTDGDTNQDPRDQPFGDDEILP